MRSKGNSPNKAQVDFRENLRALHPGSVIHHCVGTTGKHNKVEIGHWWILALDEYEHQCLHSGAMERKPFEKRTYYAQMERYFERYFQMPVPDEALHAIRDYHL